VIIDIRHAAQLLGGDVVGRDRILMPGPGHSPKDRSLAVWFNPDAPGGLLAHSFAHDDPIECRDHVFFLLGFDPWRPNRRLSRDIDFRASARARKRPPQTDTSVKRERALEIWNSARPLIGTRGEAYFRKRGIQMAAPPEIHRVLRWAPSCPWGKGGVASCIVALFTDVHTLEPRAIHRIAITMTGEKIERRMLGPSGGCVIRLWPDERVTMGLVLGEGIETVLAAATRVSYQNTLLQPAWAAGSSGNLKHFPVLSGIDTLTLLVDNDANEAGQKAAAECRDQWLAEGRKVIRLVPRRQGDFNDIVRESKI